MTKKTFLTAIAILTVGIALGFSFSRNLSNAPEVMQAFEDKKILYWVAPMDPNYRRETPGKSPMGMDLIPVYEENGKNRDQAAAVTIDPALVNSLGVRTALASRTTLFRNIETVGFISTDEDKIRHIHVRTDGWIERLMVKAEGERVNKGDLIFEMYSPTLVNAQAEYLQALRLGKKSLTGAAQERLSALGMTEGQVGVLAKSGKVEQLIQIRTPQDAFVSKLNVGEGMYIQPGTTVLSLANLSTVWVLVDVFETQANWVDVGQRVLMSLPFLPGESWDGVVDYVYPTLHAQSRTLRVRLKFANPNESLKPGMYAEITIFAAPKDQALTVPREAVIRTGRSERVIVALGEGSFRPVQVISGIESGEQVEILSGLEEGERVVTSGQFLLDSEASLNASFLRMYSRDENGKAPLDNPAADLPQPHADHNHDHDQ